MNGHHPMEQAASGPRSDSIPRRDQHHYAAPQVKHKPLSDDLESVDLSDSDDEFKDASRGLPKPSINLTPIRDLEASVATSALSAIRSLATVRRSSIFNSGRRSHVPRDDDRPQQPLRESNHINHRPREPGSPRLRASGSSSARGSPPPRPKERGMEHNDDESKMDTHIPFNRAVQDDESSESELDDRHLCQRSPVLSPGLSNSSQNSPVTPGTGKKARARRHRVSV